MHFPLKELLRRVVDERCAYPARRQCRRDPSIEGRKVGLGHYRCILQGYHVGGAGQIRDMPSLAPEEHRDGREQACRIASAAICRDQ